MLEFFGAAIFVSVGNNLFNTRLFRSIEALNIPNLDTANVVQSGATTLRQLVPAEYLPDVLVAYNDALRWAFRISLILACLSILGAVGMEWKKIKGHEKVEQEVSNGSSTSDS